MKSLSEKIKKNTKTPYQLLAEKFNTSYVYVSKIANGKRKAKRGKALLIRQELEKLATQK